MFSEDTTADEPTCLNFC